MPARIVVFGATGYTGKLTAEAMVARGLRPVLAARNRERVEQLATELGGLPTAVADVADPASVAALVGRGDVLVSTVGPFSRWGEPAVRAAIDQGAHYLDSTGEPAFIRRVFDEFGAAPSSSALFTAFGYDFVPGNLAGGLALREGGDDVRRIEVGYFVTGSSFGMSGGTRASAADIFLNPAHSRRNGVLQLERGGARVRSFEVAGKRRQAMSIGSSEAFALPRLAPHLDAVDVYLGWFGPATRVLQGLSATLAGVSAIPGAQARLSGLLQRTVKGSSGGPDERARAGSSSLVVAEAFDGSGRRVSQVVLDGVNAYEFTGRILAWGARQVAAGGVQRAGALGPVDGFGLDALQAGCAEAGIRVA